MLASAVRMLLTLLSVPQMLPEPPPLLAAGGGRSHWALPLGFRAAGPGTGPLVAAVRASWAADMNEDSELKEGKEEALPFGACACCSDGPAKPGGGPCAHTGNSSFAQQDWDW